MASGEVRTEPHVDPEIAARTDTVSRPGGDLGPAANAGHARELVAGADREVTDFTAVAGRRTPGPFTPRQLSRLDEALTLSSRETGLEFSVWVGQLEEPTREHAERLHAWRRAHDHQDRPVVQRGVEGNGCRGNRRTDRRPALKL